MFELMDTIKELASRYLKGLTAYKESLYSSKDNSYMVHLFAVDNHSIEVVWNNGATIKYRNLDTTEVIPERAIEDYILLIKKECEK